MRIRELFVNDVTRPIAPVVYFHEDDPAKLRTEVRRERDAIAALRATWSELDNPERLQSLARRHLPLRPVDTAQYDTLDRLPERPPLVVPPVEVDPIASLLGRDVDVTGSVHAQARGR